MSLHLPLVVGAGSQEGEAAEYLPMPHEMATFRMPPVSRLDGGAGTAEACAILRALHDEMTAWRFGTGEQPILVLTGLAERNPEQLLQLCDKQIIKKKGPQACAGGPFHSRDNPCCAPPGRGRQRFAASVHHFLSDFSIRSTLMLLASLASGSFSSSSLTSWAALTSSGVRLRMNTGLPSHSSSWLICPDKVWGVVCNCSPARITPPALAAAQK